MKNIILYIRGITPGSVTRSRIHFQRQSKSHWNQLVWTLEIKKKFGARPKCGNFSQNSRWRLAAILKMNFAISSHLFVIKSHVIYLNILFWTCRIHFCHQNCFLWNLNASIQYGGTYLFRKGVVLCSISACCQGHALLGTQRKPTDMDSFEPLISKSVRCLYSMQPHLA